jgi:N6-adenosine-specific RNA methylase IME4
MVSAKAVLADTVLGEREEAAATRQGELGGRFNLFLADPLWPPAEWPGMARALSDLPDAIENLIASRPVASLATEDAVLLLWSPAVMFPWAVVVMEAWGFGLRAHLAWVRTATEPGQWARVSHDVLLIGSRGRVPAPVPGLQPESVQYSGVSARSAFGFMLSYVFPELREKLDLFGTQRPPEGWSTWEGA